MITKKILIIGWVNSQPNNLLSYMKMYNNLGIFKIKHLTYPTSTLCSATQAYNWYDRYSKNNVVNTHYDVIHAFCGGSIIAFYLKHMGISYDKIIFDSGPIYPTYETFTNWCLINTPNIVNLNTNLKENFISPTIMSFIKTFWNLERNYCPLVKNLNNSINDDYESSKYLFSDHPKLVINDKSDKMIFHDKVFEMNTNKDITFHYFNNSIHVQHFKNHKEKYIDVISQFLKK